MQKPGFPSRHNKFSISKLAINIGFHPGREYYQSFCFLRFPPGTSLYVVKPLQYYFLRTPSGARRCSQHLRCYLHLLARGDWICSADHSFASRGSLREPRASLWDALPGRAKRLVDDVSRLLCFGLGTRERYFLCAGILDANQFFTQSYVVLLQI